MRLNIQGKIILLVTVIFSLAVGSIIWGNSRYFTAEYTKARQSEMFVIAQILKSQLNRLLNLHIPVNQITGFEEMCQGIVEDFNFISYAMVVSPRGMIMFHNDPKNHDQAISDIHILQGVQRSEKIIQISSVNDEEYYDLFLPLFGGADEHIATIRTGFPLKLISEKKREMTLYATWLSVIIYIIGLFIFIFVLNHWVGRPIKEFLNVIQDIRKRWGESTRRVEIKSDDEIGQLALAFNQMTDELLETTVSKAYTDNIIRSMFHSLIILNTNNEIETVNLATLDLLSYTEDELIGQSLSKVLSRSAEVEFNSRGPGIPMSAVELSYEAKDGKDIPVLFSQTAMLDNEKNTTGFICVAQDFRVIKQAKETIKEERARWRNLVEQSRDGIAVIGSKGNIVDTNKRFADMLGYSVEELHQLHVWDFDAIASREEILSMAKVIDEVGHTRESIHRRKDGSLYDVELSSNGTIYRGEKLIFSVARDMTARKQAEKEREELIKELETTLAEVKTLQGIIPICSSCKKIRDDEGYWQRVEKYIQDRSDALFSHGICEECVKELYPEFYEN